jgi:Cytochrome c oxidase subunit IV
MKVEYRLMLGVTIFLAVVAAIYWFTSFEDAGTVMLVFGGAAYGILGLFLLLQYLRRHRIPRPEDRYDASQADGAGEVGFFPNASIWPAGMGLGFVFIAVGLVFGAWFWIMGVILVLGAIIGFSVEADAR